MNDMIEGHVGLAAQEFQRVFTGDTYDCDEGGGGMPRFSYAKADRRATAYYFYLVDEVFGPAFAKTGDVNRRMVDAVHMAVAPRCSDARCSQSMTHPDLRPWDRPYE